MGGVSSKAASMGGVSSKGNEGGVGGTGGQVGQGGHMEADMQWLMDVVDEIRGDVRDIRELLEESKRRRTG